MLVIILFSLNTQPGIAVDTPGVLVYHKDAVMQAPQLEAMANDIQWITWEIVNSNLDQEDLEDKTHLILYNQRHGQLYTSNELEIIKTWYDEGGKTIWVTSDSDFFTNNGRIFSANQILEAVECRLRAESVSVRDPVHNAEPIYRLLATPNNEDAEIGSIVEGVESVLVSGPSPIIAKIDGEYQALEAGSPSDIHVILMSQVSSELVDNTSPAPEIHTVTGGRYCVLAMELVPEKHNIVIVSGESPFAVGEGMYKPEILFPSKYSELYPQQGAMLVENLLRYTVEKQWPEVQVEKGIPIPVIYVILGIVLSVQLLSALQKDNE